MSEEKAQYEGWLDAGSSIPQDTVEVVGPEYPFIQWVNGQPSLRRAGGVPYTGGWFISEAQSVSDNLGVGWEAGELVHANGSATQGWFSRDITVAVIRMRRRWIAGGDAAYPWDKYQQALDSGGGKSPKGKLQALVFVRGWFAPIVLTMGGMVSAAFQGSRRAEGVLTKFNRLVVREANNLNAKRDNKAKFPYRAFWLTIGPARDDKDAPVFAKVGQDPNTSLVTLPVALGLKDKPTPADLGALFVGRDTLEALQVTYHEAETWAHAWDGVVLPEPAEETSPPAPEANGGEDLPF